MKKRLLFSIVTFILFISAAKVAYCANTISYSATNSFTFTTGIAVNQSPTVGNTFNIANPYSYTGTLPAGLTFSTSTGIISGTPTATFSGSIIVSATFKNGSPNPASVTVNITINLNPKPVITYTSPQIYLVNSAITSLSPTNSGSAATGYSAASLPAGLSIDPVTGIISGTPTTLSSATVYTITATNASGSGTFNITITVSNTLPPAVSYSQATYVFGLGAFVSTSTPANTGGDVTDPTGWTSSPALPTGLSFSADTSGTITGTPTTLSGAATYTITATNAGGSSTFQLTISVVNNFYDWTGASSNDWATAGNWKFGGVTASSYPGQTLTTDVVHIGVAAFTNGNITVSTTLPHPVASIIFGDPSNGALNINLSIASTATLAASGNVTLNDAKEKVNLSGGGTFSIGGDYLTGKNSTLSNSGCPIIISGNFTNYGTSNFGTALLTFNGSTSTSLRSTGTQLFTNVLFTGSRVTLVQHLSGGKFAIASNGVLTMSGSAHVNVASGNITLLSDATGSATVAAIPSTCILNGNNISVQRFIKGSTDLSKRGYRLLSSTVYTGSANGVNFYDLSYLKNSVHLSGPGYAANGFDVTTTANPSIYLFREDVAPPPSNSTVFTTGYNWKGVAKINDAPLYKIGTQAKNTTTNIFDASYNLPVGNGILFFFRGDKSQAVTPIGPPNDVVLTQVGTLNTGTIQTNIWYAADDALAANTFSYTVANTPTNSGSTSSLTAGFALVGNPYPSTINWETYNKAAGALTGGVSTSIYMFNPQSKQYEVYQENPANNTDFTSEFTNTSDGSVGGTATGAASNFIASGQGFFVVATAPGQTLTFNETAKISAQPTAANLNMLMGKPADLVKAAPKPLLRLKLSLDSLNTDDIAIRLNNTSSAKYVKGEDAIDLGGSGNLVSLSSFSADSVGVPLAINNMPFPGVKPEIVGLAVGASASGTYKLTMPKLANLPALYSVWLKDAFTADSLKLTEGASYTFTIDKANPATFGNTRFSLVIGQDTANAYKLLDFTATKTDHKTEVELVWKTANEGNYTNFTIERSEGRRKPFEVIGGMRSTDAGTYSLLDKKPDNGKNFYRLKQVDINDSVTYSDVVEVKYAGKRDEYTHNLHIYPNPASHNINLSIKDDHDNGRASYSINFVNCFGMIVKQVNSSQADWEGNVSNLRPGTYLVRVMNNRTQNLIGENKFVKL